MSKKQNRNKPLLPDTETVQAELATATSMDDFFGRDGIFARLFAETMEQMMEAELSDKLGYEPYEAKGRNSGNSRNGHYPKKVRTSAGETTLNVPRDRKGEYSPRLIKKYASNTNELEEKIIGLYAKGVSTRDISATLAELYGVEIGSSTVSRVIENVQPLVTEWQNRHLSAIYPIVYLDALHMSIRHEGKVEKLAVYIVLGVDLEGHKDILGHWVGDGGEGANFWLSVLTDLQTRGVQDVFIACVDGLNGFSEAIEAVFPQALVQRCIIHQIRHSLKYVAHKDRKPFTQDLKEIYKAPNRQVAEEKLALLTEKWGDTCAMAVRSWERNWEELSTFFAFPSEIRRVIYTTNAIEGYNRQLRKVIKTKGSFPSAESAARLLYLAQENITRKWSMPTQNWAKVLNQLAIRFEGRFPL